MLGNRWMPMFVERKGVLPRWQSDFILSYMVSTDLLFFILTFNYVLTILFFTFIFLIHKYTLDSSYPPTIILYCSHVKNCCSYIFFRVYFERLLHSKTAICCLGIKITGFGQKLVEKSWFWLLAYQDSLNISWRVFLEHRKKSFR